MAGPKGRGRGFGTGKGLKKGYKMPATLEKQAAREMHRRQVTAQLEPMTDAQIASAKGIQHFVLRDKHGKFEKVTSIEAALAAMNDPASVYEFWTRDPSVHAYSYLVDQALDKAPQHQIITGPEGKPLEIVIRKPWAEELDSATTPKLLAGAPETDS